jgi:hypothetical protein
MSTVGPLSIKLDAKMLLKNLPLMGEKQEPYHDIDQLFYDTVVLS